jgi:hypothetical protein
LESSLSSKERAGREEVAKLTVRIGMASKFFRFRKLPWEKISWCGRKGTIRVVNDSSGRLIDVTGKLRQFSPGSFNLFAEREGQLRQFVCLPLRWSFMTDSSWNLTVL